MLKLKDVFHVTKKIDNESDYYLKIKILFERKEFLGNICYWSTSGSSKALIEIGLEESTGLIFEVSVVLSNVTYQQDITLFHNEITEKTGLPLFDTTPWEPIPNPLGYHVEFYDPVYYIREKKIFSIYAGEKNTTILFSLNPVVLLVVNDPVTFGFDNDNNLCYIRMQNMALNDEGFLEAVQ